MNDELGLILRDLRGAKSLLAALGEQYAEGSTGTFPKEGNYAAHSAIEEMLNGILECIEAFRE